MVDSEAIPVAVALEADFQEEVSQVEEAVLEVVELREAGKLN